ncbi:hypothetical protein [Dehalococcoides sp.]|uniref:hypothetical protein n=1 Tax=Dehalococcoides sp. TaxID=1966486 RepID=UPI0035645A92
MKSAHEQTSKNDTNSKILGVRNRITYKVDTTPENCTPEKIRQRLGILVYVALRILAREGKLQSGLTVDQIDQIWEQRNPWLRYRDGTSENTYELKVAEPDIKEIRIRLPSVIWNQIGAEARRMHISHTELARKWIIKGLNKSWRL